ncbi:RagB/SusD family nutrient uptake outer membrane protein [Chondrinema litorale]|uniref:RagB/SusD family nutrient uptake outer membrane protein n=1 Tax=Chondrinema litorale TaxID=2994555 RepID=UPI002542D5A3|nr:RagB/SusD family nutrient uptake outer membrane protein [Chondrinema litorale]UZR96921.1 RagB/SusD family nutrient uptake outer membrane protein [Chondrinema litorale]
MKKIINIYTSFLVLSMVIFSSCETDFANPNAPTDEQILTSSEGLIALSVGIKQLYSTTGLLYITETPGMTTRELVRTTTYINLLELEDGGSVLPNDNSNVSGIWATMLRIVEMCNQLEYGAENVTLEEETKNTMLAYAYFFKAISIGTLAQNFEQVVVETSQSNDAAFVSRTEGFETAIALLEQASSLLGGSVDAGFDSDVLLGNVDLINCINAFLARYNLFVGEYDAAITAANTVDLSSASYFAYDSQNQNPLWSRIVNLGYCMPADDFGLPESFEIDTTDARIDFFLSSLDTANENGFEYEELTGFYQSATDLIPVYQPGEMLLIIAEANIRKGSPDLNASVEALNSLLTKTDDPTGVNASLGEYDGTVSEEALLLEIYKNRCIELYLNGMSLEDSRRFDRPEPSTDSQVFTDERNRNFYPYPARERNNNNNTPADPAI